MSKVKQSVYWMPAEIDNRLLGPMTPEYLWISVVRLLVFCLLVMFSKLYENQVIFITIIVGPCVKLGRVQDHTKNIPPSLGAGKTSHMSRCLNGQYRGVQKRSKIGNSQHL